MTAKLIVTPGGEELAILPAEEYEDMLRRACSRHGHGRHTERDATRG